MLSLKYIRDNMDYVQNSLTQKKSKVNLSKLLECDNQRRNCLKVVEELRAERNKVSVSIAQLKKAGKDAQDDILAMRNVSCRIKNIEVELKKIEDNIAKDIYYVPNIVHSSVPVGKNETSNVEIKKSRISAKFVAVIDVRSIVNPPIIPSVAIIEPLIATLLFLGSR